MDIVNIISTAAEATIAADNADSIGKEHAAVKNAATQTIFECIKAAFDNHQMAPAQFRIEFALAAGYSCREYDIDGSYVEHDGDKMPKTAQTIISLCGKYQKEKGKLDVANVTDLRKAFKVEKTDLDKALDAVAKLTGEDLEFFQREIAKIASPDRDRTGIAKTAA